MEHPFLMFLDHTQQRTTVGRTPLDEWSARCRDLYLTTHDHSSRGVLPTVLRRCVWSRNIKNRCSICIYNISCLRVNYVVTGMWRQIAKNDDKWILFWMWCRIVLYIGTYVSVETPTSFFKVKDSYKRSVHTYTSSMVARGCFTRGKAARAWS